MKKEKPLRITSYGGDLPSEGVWVSWDELCSIEDSLFNSAASSTLSMSPHSPLCLSVCILLICKILDSFSLNQFLTLPLNLLLNSFLSQSLSFFPFSFLLSIILFRWCSLPVAFHILLYFSDFNDWGSLLYEFHVQTPE